MMDAHKVAEKINKVLKGKNDLKGYLSCAAKLGIVQGTLSLDKIVDHSAEHSAIAIASGRLSEEQSLPFGVKHTTQALEFSILQLCLTLISNNPGSYPELEIYVERIVHGIGLQV